MAGTDDDADEEWVLRVGDLETRLARTPEEVDAAQALRYRVFYDEMKAKPSPELARRARDFDKFDAYCDHVLVRDLRLGRGAEAVIGTYRLLRGDVAARHGGFYSAGEFDISKLIAYPGQALELGRSCVAAEHRNGPTMQHLWQSIADYVLRHDVTIMFGCASLPGVDPAALSLPLAYLYHHHLAPPAVRARALPERYVDMDLVAPEAIDIRAAATALPPLLKGYLRLGGVIGDGAVIDHQFNTTDVCVIVVIDQVTDKYSRHYLRDLDRNREAERR
ncbi:MAG: GNAT family N-acetyltransferase [Alphaproteobacteria bacterium]